MLRWILNFVVTSTSRVVQNRAVGHITVVGLKLTNRSFWTTLKVDVTTKFKIQRNISYISDSQLQLLYS
jgi:hypothetical protein